MRRGMFAYTCP